MSTRDEAAGWAQVCPAWARTAVVADPEDGAVLLLTHGADRCELWRWAREGFHRERAGVFPHLAPGRRCSACWLPQIDMPVGYCCVV